MTHWLDCNRFNDRKADLNPNVQSQNRKEGDDLNERRDKTAMRKEKYCTAGVRRTLAVPRTTRQKNHIYTFSYSLLDAEDCTDSSNH